MPTKTKKPRPLSPPRLYVILARNSSMAVVFRRGPSKQVQLILWDTIRDKFYAGQWFKGRIYERRCDLSPSGEKLIYFAASQKQPYYSWTAISRPPFLTALALWPKGDCWGGGGLFKTERLVQLNHGAMQTSLADGFRLPKDLALDKPIPWAGHGEDDPIQAVRLQRDGWVHMNDATKKKYGYDTRTSTTQISYAHNEVWSKTRGCWRIDMLFLGHGEVDGPWNVVEHFVRNDDETVVLPLGRSDWADWSNSGDVLFAKKGCLYRIRVSKKSGLGEPGLLIDLSKQKFKRVEPDPKALKWKGPMPDGTLIR